MNKIKKVLMIVGCTIMYSMFAIGSGSSGAGETTANKVGETENHENYSDISGSENTEIKAEYVVGDTLSVDGLSITYVSSCDYISDNQFIQPADGNKFIRLYFYVDNQSGMDQSVSVYNFACYADGYDCELSYQDDDLSGTVSNGRSTDGAVYFEIPVDAVEVEVEYELDWITSEKAKFIFEGDKESGLVFEKNTSVSENAFHIGDIIETNKLRIVYNNAAEYKSDNMFLQPNEGMKYVYIELEVENLSDTDQSISYFSFNCYADGSACDGFYGMDDALSAELSAGRKAKGTVAFEVPKDAQTIEIEFEDNLWTNSKIVFLYE